MFYYRYNLFYFFYTKLTSSLFLFVTEMFDRVITLSIQTPLHLFISKKCFIIKHRITTYFYYYIILLLVIQIYFSSSYTF